MEGAAWYKNYKSGSVEALVWNMHALSKGSVKEEVSKVQRGMGSKEGAMWKILGRGRLEGAV